MDKQAERMCKIYAEISKMIKYIMWNHNEYFKRMKGQI